MLIRMASESQTLSGLAFGLRRDMLCDPGMSKKKSASFPLMCAGASNVGVGIRCRPGGINVGGTGMSARDVGGSERDVDGILRSHDGRFRDSVCFFSLAVSSENRWRRLKKLMEKRRLLMSDAGSSCARRGATPTNRSSVVEGAGIPMTDGFLVSTLLIPSGLRLYLLMSSCGGGPKFHLRPSRLLSARDVLLPVSDCPASSL
jgi:hypothetical protein